MRDKIMRISSGATVVWLALNISSCSPPAHNHDLDPGTGAEKPERSTRSVAELIRREHVTEADLESLANEDIWELGILRFAWSPGELPDDWSRNFLIASFLEDEGIKDHGHGLGYDELGYLQLESEDE